MQALTHSTYAYENRSGGVSDNERLEFLGDSVLGLTVGGALFQDPDGMSEGDMSTLRALVVCEQSLARAARKIGLGDVLFLGIGEERTGGRDKDSNLSNAMEALFGAVFMDAGFEQARGLVMTHMKDPYADARAGRLVHDYKSRLYEIAQSWKPAGTVRFCLVAEEGEDHEKVFHTRVEISGESFGDGKGHSKKESEQDASRKALQRLRKM